MTFPATSLPHVRMRLRLHRAGFHTNYPTRRVNNVYFDSLGLGSFHEILAGVARRVKLRLRWYGEDVVVRNGVLELKYKQGLARWKRSSPVRSVVDLAAMRWPAIVDAVRAEAPPWFGRAFDVAHHPVIINRYAREYLVSSDGTVRITLDAPQIVFSQRVASRPNLRVSVSPHERVVLEVKADATHRDRLADVLSELPIVAAKHSKYVTAVRAASL